jgi:hypothetical protein
MKKSLLFVLFIIFMVSVEAQKDTLNIASYPNSRSISSEHTNSTITIYPVPVRDNYFTIKSDKEITFIKITNIIGQDIFRAQYNNPLTLNKINLDNPKRGMYLVTLLFKDGTRVVRKIMIEQSE